MSDLIPYSEQFEKIVDIIESAKERAYRKVNEQFNVMMEKDTFRQRQVRDFPSMKPLRKFVRIFRYVVRNAYRLCRKNERDCSADVKGLLLQPLFQ